MLITIKQTNRQVLFHYEYANGRNEFSHILTIPPGIHPRDTSLAKIALFARPDDNACYRLLGAGLDAATQAFLSEQLNAEIKAETVNDPNRSTAPVTKISPNAVLCFSGGFDSLAAKCTIDDRVRTMSIDFGGEFGREAESFSQFDTTVFQWQLRGKRKGQSVRFDEKRDWRFLFAPALCYEDERSLTIVAGTILESSRYWFSGNTREDFTRYSDSSFGPGTAMASPVSMLSEYGTALVIDRCCGRSSVDRSLASLASPTSFKRYRKMVLLAIVRGESVPPCPPSLTRYSFGRQFTDDVVTLYLTWKLGPDWVKNNYCHDIPDDARFDMSFFERIHRENLKTVDPELADSITRRMASYGMTLTSDAELQEIERVKEFITACKTTRHEGMQPQPTPRLLPKTLT